jgi:hypothetical protein
VREDREELRLARVGLPQGLLSPLAIGDVPERDLERLAFLVLEHGRDPFHAARASVEAEDRHLDARVHACLTVEQPAAPLPQHGAMGRVEELRGRLPEELVRGRGPEQRDGGGVRERDAVVPGDQDRVRGELDEGAVPLLDRAERLLGAPQVVEPAVPLGHEVLDGSREGDVEPRAHAGEIERVIRRASRRVELRRRSAGDEHAQDRRPEQRELPQDLGEMESVVGPLRGVSGRARVERRLGGRVLALDPVGELVEELRQLVPQRGAGEPRLHRRGGDDRLDLPNDLVPMVPKDASRYERQRAPPLYEGEGE